MLAALLTAAIFSAEAALPNQPAYISSYSRQFLVHGQASTLPPPLQIGANAPIYVSLDPQVLTVMAERIKEAFLALLRQPDVYTDKIYLHMSASARPETAVRIVSRLHTDGWQYHVSLPSVVEQDRLFKGLLQVIISEYANRQHRRGAEIPTWLLEGLHRELANSSLHTYQLSRNVVRTEVRANQQLTITRAFLSTNAPLSLHELSFPTVNFNNPREGALYRASAFLFVHELLGMKDGPALFATFIRSLPATLNWQTAFLQVYSRQFKTLLDLEKWWALTCVDFRGHAGSELWPPALSAQKLHELLLTSLELRTDANSLPARRRVSLSELLVKTDFATHKPLLERKLRDLQFLSYQLSRQVLALAFEYRATLENYLIQREEAGVRPGLRQDPEQRLQLLLKQSATRLSELDQLLVRVPAAGGATTVLQNRP